MSLVLLIIAILIAGYGSYRYQLKNHNLGLIKNHPLIRIFPSSWLLTGNEKYYNLLDMQASVQDYQKAISHNPLLMEAWIGLGKARLAQGNRVGALKIQNILESQLSKVTTWKWEEILLAFELKTQNYFADCFNFVLSRIPQKRREACYLAEKYWSNLKEALPYVEKKNYPIFLNQSRAAHKTETALAVWEKMENPDQDLGLGFCQYLLAHNRLSQAKRVWKKIQPNLNQYIYNGGFEKNILNRAFGWRIKSHPQVMVELSSLRYLEGRRSLHIDFFGTANVKFRHLKQIIPLDPGKTYRLTYAQKSRKLTTDQGLYIQVTGYRCPGLGIKSKQVQGTHPWEKKSLQFEVPKACEAILLRLQRDKSLMFDNKIFGDFWLDNLKLESLGSFSCEKYQTR